MKIIDSRAGVSVVAQPGDLLLNKNAGNQNYGVGFRTTVFAAPGSVTIARGISVFCLDHDRTIALEGASTSSGRPTRCRAMSRWGSCSR